MKHAFTALTMFVGMMSAVATGGDTPSFKITTKRDNDTVEVRADKEKTVFIVKSPFGISNAVIERTGEKWPDAVVLRLHLKGLENFKVTNGKGSTSTGIDADTMNLSVDVISDVICPWCFIGKRRLEKAIALHGEPVNVRWLPFQLNPNMPKDGISRRDYRTKKFGSWERSLELDAQMAAAGEAEGIHFAFNRTERTPNTVDAHRLIWLADLQGVQDAVMEKLFSAYFTEGRDISNRQTLIDVVAEAGLDRQRAEAVLNGDEGMKALKEAEGLSRQHRVDGVPFFIINGKITLGGAQPPEAFLAAFDQAGGSK